MHMYPACIINRAYLVLKLEVQRQPAVLYEATINKSLKHPTTATALYGTV